MKVPTSDSSDMTNGKPFFARPDAAPPKGVSDSVLLLNIADSLKVLAPKWAETTSGVDRLRAIAARLAAHTEGPENFTRILNAINALPDDIRIGELEKVLSKWLDVWMRDALNRQHAQEG